MITFSNANLRPVRATVRNRLWSVVVLWILAGSVALAAVSPEEEQVKLAKIHFAAGVAYYNQERFVKAIEEFKEAYRVSHRIPILFNIARCYELLGNTGEALSWLHQYQSLLPPDAAADRAEVEEHLGKIEIQKEDARPNEQAAPVPPAKPELAPPVLPPPQLPKDILVPVSARPKPVLSRAYKRRQLAGFVLGGVGAVALISAIGTGATAQSLHDSLTHTCPSQACPSASANDIHEMQRLAVSTDVLLAVGIGAVATSAILFVINWRQPRFFRNSDSHIGVQAAW